MVKVTVLGSGSSGNATVISMDGVALLIDAGFSGIELKRRLEAAGVAPEAIVGILISHEHGDHVRGLRVFCKRHGNLTAYLNMLTAERLQVDGNAPEKIVVFSNGAPFKVGPFRIDAFSVSHDAVDPVGFVVHCGEIRIGIATDFGHPGVMIPLKLKNCQVLILESNHDPEMLLRSERPPRILHRIRGRRGHLSNADCASLLDTVAGPETRHVVLAHLSGDCNRRELAEAVLRRKLKEMNRLDIAFQIASQDHVSQTISL